MSGQHTPGPWHLCDSSGDRGPGDYGPRWEVHIPGKQTIADVHKLADAHLIKAVPDLVAVMTEVLPYLEEGYMEDEDDDEPIGWQSDADGANQRPVLLTFGMIRRFRAALAKARGETL